MLPDGILYHYPETGSPGRDATEIAATKNAMTLNLPVFVVIDRGALRDLHLGWVEDFDDGSATFLIDFWTRMSSQSRRSRPDLPHVLARKKSRSKHSTRSPANEQSCPDGLGTHASASG